MSILRVVLAQASGAPFSERRKRPKDRYIPTLLSIVEVMSLEKAMKNGQCPKCGSSDVHSGSMISFKQGAFGSNTIPLGGILSGSAMLDNYVCVNCGYVESYMGNVASRRQIAQKWPRVQRQ